ncbi:FecCD family ABC transporter permease [Marinomonas rhizomae]|uniref:Iron complex transport system permease protein n=1 Tax=Marinomonas rhizomae TaxID=491948 RepID=A0A366IX70_9GAMM|nr:iron ABC transporter permease [Marinomonas rhizomae]RBP79416.1 iron complex transport system permease protein [Marinomonas rhizomae]
MAIPFTLGLMLFSTFWALVVGAVPLSESDILTYVSHGFAEGHSSLSTRVLFEIRLPRTILSLCVGGALGLCGAAMQALFRNPLADPSLIGVAGGGALGAVTVIVLGNSLWPQAMAVIGQYALPIGAMLGCLGVCAIIYRLSNRQGQFTIITLLLSGIAVNAIVGSLIGILTLVSSDSELRELTFWTMGNLGGNSWALTLPVLALILISLIGLSRLAKPLNLYLLGEAQAQHLGVSVSHLKRQVFIYTAMAVGAAVSISGMIGFVGFVVPHLVRILIGPDHRFLFPVSMLFGASFLTITDVIARIVIVPAELPIGLVTSALGGPFFLFVLYKQTGRY